MRWLSVSLNKALLLDCGQPVIKILETGVVGDVVHKHYCLKLEERDRAAYYN